MPPRKGQSGRVKTWLNRKPQKPRIPQNSSPWCSSLLDMVELVLAWNLVHSCSLLLHLVSPELFWHSCQSLEWPLSAWHWAEPPSPDTDCIRSLIHAHLPCYILIDFCHLTTRTDMHAMPMSLSCTLKLPHPCLAHFQDRTSRSVDKPFSGRPSLENYQSDTMV